MQLVREPKSAVPSSGSDASDHQSPSRARTAWTHAWKLSSRPRRSSLTMKDISLRSCLDGCHVGTAIRRSARKSSRLWPSAASRACAAVRSGRKTSSMSRRSMRGGL